MHDAWVPKLPLFAPPKTEKRHECTRMRANARRMRAKRGPNARHLWPSWEPLGGPTEPECKAGFRASLSQGGTKLTFGSISNKMIDERSTMHAIGVCLQAVFNEWST